MTISNGVDLVYLPRFEKSLKNPRFLSRVFGEEERELYGQRGENSSFLAGNFAAKEAFSKALGTGVRGFHLSHVQILRNSLGAPYFFFAGTIKEFVIKHKLQFSISISHHEDYVIAMVTGWSQN